MIPRRLLSLGLLCLSAAARPTLHAVVSREITWSIASDPHTFDPAQVEDASDETIRYLTGGVLVRVNRQTQALEPALAEKWTLSPDGKTLTFRLRANLQFSDGSPLTAKDAAWSIRHVLEPKTQSPLAEEFISPSKVVIDTPDARTVRLHLPERIPAFGSLFDEIAVQPAGGATDSRITAGIYVVDAYQRGVAIHLRHNDHYWKQEPAGNISSINLEIMQNRDEEVTRFRRGQLSLIPDLHAEYIALINQHNTNQAHDFGPSLDTEQMWFNQSPDSPLPEAEKTWFRDRSFRVAVSQAIHRSDIVRIAFAGHATPADSFISPANTRWRNPHLNTPKEDTAAALGRLHDAGFTTRSGKLYDRSNRPVTFSLVTNAGNSQREHTAALIQQDLAALGIQVNIVALGFPELIDRLMHTHNYEACLLGTVNVQPDPSTAANVWLSSSEDHAWNPHQASPATPWEQEIDALIHQQGETLDYKRRRQAWDRIQQIVADQQPFIYLVHRNVTYAVSPAIHGIAPAAIRPQLLWNIDAWTIASQAK